MKPTAIGRILIWRGSSLWIGHAGEPTDVHAHHAVQLALPFRDGHVSFARPSSAWVRYPAAVIPANEPHAFEARSQFMAQIFVEPESVPGVALQRRYRDGGITPLPIDDIRDQVESLACAYERRAPDGELFALSQSIVASLAGATPGPDTTDPRIGTAIAELKARLDESISLDSVASSVGLSPDRFRHLFVAQTGVAFRPYILWLRLERALAAYVSGDSLTDAAQAGGFADSAHFSRTFRRMFGIAPVSVRPE